MTLPFFSIITIARNVQEGLRKTAVTLEMQHYRDFEWIIIDGASTDGTKEFAEAQFAKGIAVGISEPDAGIYDAMNKGLLLARGEYVLFLNAGDRLADPQSLRDTAHDLLSAESPDIGFFGSLMDFGRWSIARVTKDPGYIWHGQPGLHQATFVRRTLHQRFPFSMDYKIVGDYDALARMAQSGASMRSFRPIVSVNEFEASAMSGRNKLRLIMEAAGVQRKVLKLPYHRIALSVGRRAFNSMFFKVATSIQEVRNG